MKTRHTPGPWRTGDMYNTIFGPPNGNPCPEIVANVHKGNRANARLIAKAPEMKAEIEGVLMLFHRDNIPKYQEEGPGWVTGVRVRITHRQADRLRVLLAKIEEA